jgi:serine phosphatase RsbU (regulator of sigma subunit)
MNNKDDMKFSVINTVFKKITSAGIHSDLSFDEAEKIKLVNTISFIGVPICIGYALIFGLNQYYFHSILFIVGLLVFVVPPLLNRWVGLKLSVPVFTISTPLFWSFLSIATGRDTGFYLGFIIFGIGPMLFFRTLREAIFYVWLGIILFFVSLVGLMIFPPVVVIPFANVIFLVNLITVLFTIVIVVYLFKQESDDSRTKIQEKNREILDSINYAKRIQSAILPSESSIKNKLKDCFIFYSPKDIVAGDFYWMEEVDGKILLAAADCTGHGVPGALVSLVCYNALNKAVIENKQTDPGKILDLTKKFVVEHFSKNIENVKDGMDISLVSIDLKTKTVLWAGANNPFWYVQNNELKSVQSTKQSIGLTETTVPFTSHIIQLNQNDCIYLFTDGLADQFGGAKGKKFMYKSFKSLLLENSNLPMFEQNIIIRDALMNWKGTLEQVDDILVVGLRL